MQQKITGLVLTFNGERLLDACLESLSFCDRILVVDSNSSDATREIAEKHGVDVLVRAWEGPAPQFRFALENIDTDWVVGIDQDERVTAELRENILKAVNEAAPESAGFYCSRRSYYFDRFLKHSGWYPDRLLRIYRPEKMEVRTDGPHYSFHPLGPTGRISGDIEHIPYKNLSEHIGKINYYTEEAAKELKEKGKTSSLFTALVHGLARFFKIYLLKLGILDGKAGFVLAVHGFFYAFHKYLRVLEPEECPEFEKKKASGAKPF